MSVDYKDKKILVKNEIVVDKYYLGVIQTLAVGELPKGQSERQRECCRKLRTQIRRAVLGEPLK